MAAYFQGNNVPKMCIYHISPTFGDRILIWVYKDVLGGKELILLIKKRSRTRGMLLIQDGCRFERSDFIFNMANKMDTMTIYFYSCLCQSTEDTSSWFLVHDSIPFQIQNDAWHLHQ